MTRDPNLPARAGARRAPALLPLNEGRGLDPGNPPNEPKLAVLSPSDIHSRPNRGPNPSPSPFTLANSPITGARSAAKFRITEGSQADQMTQGSPRLRAPGLPNSSFESLISPANR